MGIGKVFVIVLKEKKKGKKKRKKVFYWNIIFGNSKNIVVIVYGEVLVLLLKCFFFGIYDYKVMNLFSVVIFNMEIRVLYEILGYFGMGYLIFFKGFLGILKVGNFLFYLM